MVTLITRPRCDDVKKMNIYINKVALQTFSYFDTGKNPSDLKPERFYHGFVLGMMVELADRYVLTSNRESGFGWYDIMLEPKQSDAKGAALVSKGIPRERIRKYGFAFCGKKVMIGKEGADR